MLKPLAELLRPTDLTEIIGQEHLIGDNGALKPMLQAKIPQSIILWGPPGVGKTSLANVLINLWDCYAIKLSAVFSGIKEIKDALNAAEQNATGLLTKPTVLFIDEIHRFNKAQQDSFLSPIETGKIILIGATTENPSFELNKALLSRVPVYVLNNLSAKDLYKLLTKALAQTKNLQLTKEAAELLVDLSDGDARRLLNLLETISGATVENQQLDIQELKQLLPSNIQRFDKGGEEFYNQISALHKAVRGSDPDAALYWFGRMLNGGAEPLYIGRRMLRMAWEDIGLADTNAATVVNNALTTYERLGSPEGELALAGAVIYLAVTNKSNSVDMAYKKLRDFVSHSGSEPVPIHLRNAPTKLMAELGYGKEYKYAHSYPNHYVPNERYFPDNLTAQDFYQPTNQGFEQKIAERLNFLRDLDNKK